MRFGSRSWHLDQDFSGGKIDHFHQKWCSEYSTEVFEVFRWFQIVFSGEKNLLLTSIVTVYSTYIVRIFGESNKFESFRQTWNKANFVRNLLKLFVVVVNIAQLSQPTRHNSFGSLFVNNVYFFKRSLSSVNLSDALCRTYTQNIVL